MLYIIWNSNVEELEHYEHNDVDESFAKQQLAPRARSEQSKLLGLPWNKREDTLSVVFPLKSTNTTKRGILSTLANVYERFWIPRLRKLTKRVLKCCWGCKRFRATPFTNPPTAPLPKDRT